MTIPLWPFGSSWISPDPILPRLANEIRSCKFQFLSWPCRPWARPFAGQARLPGHATANPESPGPPIRGLEIRNAMRDGTLEITPPSRERTPTWSPQEAATQVGAKERKICAKTVRRRLEPRE